MADLKISQLTGASTPLAGTEVLPIVQSGSTKQVSVANLTAGRSVTTGILTVIAGNGDQFNLDNTGQQYVQQNFKINGVLKVNMYYDNSGNKFTLGATSASSQTAIQSSGTERIVFDASGNASLNNGNFVPATAAKGVNFTANTPAAGMTSQLLNWYEEGTWTPAQGGGLTVVGAFSSTGRYTRIGRQVTVSGTVTGATSVAVAAAGIVTTNLPFTVVTAGHGNATNAAVNASAAVICTTTNVTSASAIAATETITFSATYFV